MRHRIRLKGGWRLSGEERTCVRACIRTTLGKPRYTGRVDVFIVGDGEIRRINRNTRGRDKPTDVLSFPAVDFPAGEVPVPDPDDGRVFLGDLIISIDRSRVQSWEFGLF